ncbi:WD40-repeat-containing domain protein [Mucidula mucida]|nr:WD40-repeat-containing domain protein [Mucidula mucida]
MFRQVQSIRCATSTANLCLSLDWSNRRDSGTSLGSLVVSLSNGSLCILRPDATSSALTVETTWHAHDYEPWIAACNYWDNNVVFSGGDDLQLKGWDIRDTLSLSLITPRFDAGITTIQSHPFVENLISVGSYDNLVRLFDTRKPLVPLCQTNVGGGVWRVKWHPSPERKNDLLVACMHDGFKVVNFGQMNSSSNGALLSEEGVVVKRFDEHESLAYGVDWSFSSLHVGESTIASCSFYDHLLHIWRG